MKQGKKLAISTIAAVMIAVVGVYYAVNIPKESATAENITLGQIANTIESTTNLRAIVIQEKVNSIDGVALAEKAKSTNSGILERTGDASKEIFKKGQAELVLNRGVGSDGNEYVSATITNT